MSLIDAASYASVAYILYKYWRGSPSEFDIANALLFIPVSLPAILAGVWPNVIISCTFGIIALKRVYKRWRNSMV